MNLENIGQPFPFPTMREPEWLNDQLTWHRIIWKDVESMVFRLQKRIYKAAKAGQLGKAKNLAKLLLRSRCSIILNVRRVTQDNSGKKTAGIDGVKSIKPEDRMKLVKELTQLAKAKWAQYHAKPIRRVFIPKDNGKQRPLGIPTIKDRAVQGVFKTVMEPKFEAEFEPNSYGFRPAMSCHDAIADIFNCLNKKKKWILDADIKGFFDNIDHQFLINSVNKDQKQVIRKWLKAGIMDGQTFLRSELGTPQGGIISPLLANLALDGMEEHLIEQLKTNFGYNTKNWLRNGQLRIVRYADDFVVMHEDKRLIERSQVIISKWLTKRGVALSEEKTRIVNSAEGFDFLGFNVKHYDNQTEGYEARKFANKQGFKLLIKPSNKSIKKHNLKIKEVFRTSKSITQEVLIKRLNPIIKGWTNYFRIGVSSDIFSKMDYLMWEKLWAWGKRRHGLKNKHWIVNKYFHTMGTRKWQFATYKDGNPSNVLTKYADTKIKRHLKVQAGRSYFDGDKMYWASRLSKGYGDISPSKAKILKRQDCKCIYCKETFKNEDVIEIHHIKFKKDGGDSKYSNLSAIHNHCHDQYHAQETISRIESGRLPGEVKSYLGF